METKEKTPEAGRKPAPRKRRPAAGTRKAAAPKAGTKAAPKRPAPDAAVKKKAPQKKRRSLFAKPKKKNIPKPTNAGYRPHKQENDRKRAARNQELARNISDFFSYRNPILRMFRKSDMDVFGDGFTDPRTRKADAEERKRKRAAQLKTPAVIYTQPRTFNRSRLVIQLMTVLAVVLALVMGMSVFFKVKVITVSGAKVYSAWTVREKSGIVEGDNLLTFGRTRASGQIIANLPYVKSARIGIKLPDTVHIEIEEEDVVYAIQDQDGVWWLINSNGKIVEQTSSAYAKNYTQVLGVTLSYPQSGERCIATEEEPTETNDEGEFIPVTVTGSVRLNAAMEILRALEANDIVGSATSVDVTQIEDIILWYGSQYQVNLGNTSRMDYKIACMNDVILQMSDYQTGILDVSFTTWTDQVGYTPFG